MRKYIIIIAVFISLVSCEKYFVPQISRQDKILVIDGFITNEFKKHVIKLSYSVAFNQQSIFVPGKGFNVTIECSNGDKFLLAEQNFGKYITVDSVAGAVGLGYRVVALSPEGQTYMSAFDTMLAVAPITSLKSSFEQKKQLDILYDGSYTEVIVDGVTVLANSVTKNCSPFNRYNYNVVFQTSQIYATVPMPTNFYLVSPITSINRGFIKVANANQYQNGEISMLPVDFIEKKLMFNKFDIKEFELDDSGEPVFSSDQITVNQHGFIFTLKQYSLTQQAYNFWEAISQQLNSSGQLFDPLESQLNGNIYCLNDTTQTVFGYFSASAVSQIQQYIYLRADNRVYERKVENYPVIDSVMYLRGTTFDFWINN